MLLCNLLLDFAAEFFFALDNAFAQYLVEEFLIELSRNETADFVHLIGKLACVVGSLFLSHLEQGGELGVTTSVSLGGVEGEDIVHLGSGEDVLLLLVFEIGGHECSVLNDEAAILGLTILVQFCENTANEVALLVLVDVFVVASTTSELLHLVFQFFFAHLNVVVFHVVVGRERGG